MKPKTIFIKILLELMVFLAVILITGIIFGSCGKDVSVTPPDSPPPDGFVFINSNPKGFHIYIDGKARRRSTPDSLTWLKTGTYLVTLKKELFRDSSLTINIVEGKKISLFVDITMNPLMRGQIYCTSKPSGAEVFLNDSSSGKFTPATLVNILPGNYEVRYHLKNHKDDSLNISVSSNNISTTYLILVDTTIWSDYNTNNSGIFTNTLTCVTVDKKDVVWAGTNKEGAISFDGKNWGGKQLFNTLPDQHINCISVNSDGAIFMGTNRGFIRYDGVNMDMYGFKTSELQDYFVEAISFDNYGDWYIGTRGGLTRSYLINGNRTWSNYDSTQVPDNWITSIIKDKSNNLWVGMKDNGITRRNASMGWNVYNYKNSRFINNNVTALAESPTGEIWAGFDKGLVAGNGISYFNGSLWNNVYPILSDSKTNSILVDRYNNKWIATDKGLVTFQTITDVKIFNYENTGLNLNNVTGVAQDSHGNIWISTWDGGLIEYKANR